MIRGLVVFLLFIPALAQTEAGKINTLGWADSPYLTPDGQRLYFMYTPFNFMPLLLRGENAERRGPQRPGHHTNPDGNPYGDSDIYVAERQPDGSWGVPVNLSINDDGADACPVLTSDGKTIYWQKATTSADIYVAHQQDDDGWGTPQRLPDSVNTPDYHEVNPHISADEQTLYFTSDRPGGFGGMDIYVSTNLGDERWSEAQNLGPVINTPEDDDQVWISEDGQTMYYNRGGQIFTSTLHDGSWQPPAAIRFVGGAPMFAAEASLTSNGQLMILAVPDVENERLWIMQSVLQTDGRWSQPEPID